MGWFRQLTFEHRRTFHLGFGPHQLLGRIFGFDHGSAKIPTALDVQAHLQSQAVGFAQSVFIKLPPLRTEKRRTMWDGRVSVLLRAAGIANQRAAESLL